MATMAGIVVCSKAPLLLSHFPRTTTTTTTTTSSSSLRLRMRATPLSSASSSFQGRLCLALTCPPPTGFKARRTTGVQASLLGVGAPEALVIGVVALLVFGPKGLAEVARTLGKSLRAFQPTIKELQQVSREFKATLEQEIGLDEMRNPSPYDSPPTSTPARPNSTSMPTTLSATETPPAPVAEPKTEESPAPPKPYTTEDYMRVTEEQAKALVPEEQRKAAEAAAWEGAPPVKPVKAETSSEEGQAETTSVVGSTPSEPLEKPSDNGSPKL